MESHITNVLKLNYQEFKTNLPVFKSAYQPWYTEAQALIKILLPLRYSDFVKLYEKPKNRKEITRDNDVIEDYLNDTIVTAGFDKKNIAGPDAGISAFEQQFQIFGTILTTLDSSLIDIRREIQAELLDAELEKAGKLSKNKHLRAAGAIAGLALEKHLEQICGRHLIKITRKTIKEMNETLRKAGLIDFPNYSQIGFLEEISNLCFW